MWSTFCQGALPQSPERLIRDLRDSFWANLGAVDQGEIAPLSTGFTLKHLIGSGEDGQMRKSSIWRDDLSRALLNPIGYSLITFLIRVSADNPSFLLLDALTTSALIGKSVILRSVIHMAMDDLNLISHLPAKSFGYASLLREARVSRMKSQNIYLPSTLSSIFIRLRLGLGSDRPPLTFTRYTFFGSKGLLGAIYRFILYNTITAAYSDQWLSCIFYCLHISSLKPLPYRAD